MEVVERVKKCLARARHATANENEARAAMMMASKIMQQHNISQAQIMEDEDDAQRLKRGGMSTVNIGPRTPSSKIRFETWVLDLARAMCTFFECKAFSTKKPFFIQWTFYGVAEHTASAAMAFEMTHNLIQGWAYPIHGVGPRNSYCLGLAQGLRYTAEEELKAAKDALEAAERAAKERETKSTAVSNSPSSTPFQQPSVVEIDSDEDSERSTAKFSPVQRSPVVEIDSDEDSEWSAGTFTPVLSPPTVETDSDEDSTWSEGTSTPVQRPPILKIDTQYQTPTEISRPASSVLKEQLMDLVPDAEDAITKILSRYEIGWRTGSDEKQERRNRNFNERLERLERLAASQPLPSQRLKSAPVTPPWQSASPSPYLQNVPVTPSCQSASPSPYLPTPLLRAGNKRRWADNYSGTNGVDQSEPAAKKGRFDDGVCGHCSAPIDKPSERNEDRHQSEEMSKNNSVLAETSEGDYQSEGNSEDDSVRFETSEGGHQSEETSKNNSVLAETNKDDYQSQGNSETDSDDNSDLADFNDQDSETIDITAPFETELQKEVVKARSAPAQEPITSDPPKSEWASSTQLTIYRENVAKIAEDFLKAHNIKLRAGKKRTRSVKDEKRYAQGVRNSKKINVRGSRIED